MSVRRGVGMCCCVLWIVLVGEVLEGGWKATWRLPSWPISFERPLTYLGVRCSPSNPVHAWNDGPLCNSRSATELQVREIELREICEMGTARKEAIWSVPCTLEDPFTQAQANTAKVPAGCFSLRNLL